MAGHVSKDMVKHYSHIRTEAKRRAVEKLVSEPAMAGEKSSQQNPEAFHKGVRRTKGELV
jgi:hypothetical protein